MPQDSDLESLIRHENEHWTKIFKNELEQEKLFPGRTFSSPWWREYYEEMTCYMAKRLARVENPRILEAGSGSGKASILLGDKAQITLLDISSVALDFAKHLAGKFKVTAIQFVQGDIFQMPFPDKSFNFVWNIGVLEHYEEDKAVIALAEMMRVATLYGEVAIGMPNFSSGPMIKARLLRLRFFSWIPGYRLDSEKNYRIKDIKQLCSVAATKVGRKIKEIQVVRFGNPLFMEAPGWVLSSAGRLLAWVCPRLKFLNFIIVVLE